jgi:Rhodopirellula transposase DDE domain
VVEHSTAGLPQDACVKWTHLSQVQITSAMADNGCPVSRYHVRQLLRVRGFRKRKLLKSNELKMVEGRNEQFEKIATLRKSFTLNDQPILSIDTKKKELLGNFHRQGSTYSTGKRTVNDHDFLTFADGQLVPHGIYDVRDNTGYITLGTSKDTSEFVCDNLKSTWLSHLQFKYPEAHTMLLLCDGGGSNSCLHHIFKQDMINLAKELNINILVSHYPAYCSKYNPIEHRLFSQISHTWSGVPLTNIQFVKELTNTTTTKTGLKVTTTINPAKYQTKRPVADDFKNQLQKAIIFDDLCPKWNYLIKCQT